MRRWGIADSLAAAAPFGIDYPSNIHFVTRLSGYSLARFDNAMNCLPVRNDHYPEHSQWIPQYKLENILRAKLLTLDCVDFRVGTELIDLEHRDDGISAQVRRVATQEIEMLEATYIVGADGARSTVREKMGIKMVGSRGVERLNNFVIHAPGLADAHGHGPGAIYWQINPETPSILCNMDSGDLWSFGPTLPPGNDPLSDDDVVALVKRATGIDIPYTVVWRDSWAPSRALADRYQQGRAFLIGDACHLHPPFGGFGMNLGVADAVDLGWKIAAVLQGWGGSALLDSYEAERRPIAKLVLEEADRNFSVLPNQLFRDGIEEDSSQGAAIRTEVGALIEKSKRDEFYALGVLLGLRYCGSPIIINDGTESGWALSRDYVPNAAPGHLAPHKWLQDGSSLYDRFGEGFTLLVLDDFDASDIARAQADARRTGVPLAIVSLDELELRQLYGATRALVRPDQLIAWRGDAWPHSDLLAFVAGWLQPEDTEYTRPEEISPTS